MQIFEFFITDITDINSHSNSYIIKLTSPQTPTAWVACDYPRPPATQAKPAYNKTAASSFLCILKCQVKSVLCSNRSSHRFSYILHLPSSTSNLCRQYFEQTLPRNINPYAMYTIREVPYVQYKYHTVCAIKNFLGRNKSWHGN